MIYMNPAKLKTRIRAKKFAAEYIENGCNGKQAYLSISPNVTSQAAEVGASRMLSKDKVIQEIALRVEAIDQKWVQEQLEYERSLATRSADRIRCIENQAKIIGILRDTNININNANGISAEDIKRIREGMRSKSIGPLSPAVEPPKPIIEPPTATNESSS